MPRDEIKPSGNVILKQAVKRTASHYEMGPSGKLVFIVLFLLVAAGFTWYFVKYQKAAEQISFLSSPEGRVEVDKQEVERIMTSVSKHILLPDGQTPTIATIQDAESLISQQPFFANTQNGDVVLAYTDKVFVYSPARDLLVNVGPLYYQNQQGQPVPPPAPPAPVVSTVKLDIRNGSETVGLAQSLAQDLAEEYEVVNTDNAANTDYTGIVLVNLSGADVSDLEARLGVTAVASLPDGEKSGLAKIK